jgi:integrase
MADGDLIVSPPACAREATATGQNLVRRAAEVAEYAVASKSPATRRAYDHCWRSFEAWCAEHGLKPLPADPNDVAFYLIDRAKAGLRISTLNQHLAAIADAHQLGGEALPSGPWLTQAWGGIRRKHAKLPRKVSALVTADLRRVCAKLPAGPAGVRDKALLLIGFAGAFRRSELVVLAIGDTGNRGGHQLSIVPAGVQILMGRTKTDQEMTGRTVAIPRGKTKICPVAALEAWLALARISAGPVFRGVDRHGRISPRGLSDRAVADIVKRAVVRAGLNPSLFSGHSLRSGFVTSASQAGVATEVIMLQTGHRDPKTVAGYIRDAELWTRNPAGKLGL